MKKIIGIFGGTFDPPHLGHYGIARRVLELNLVDEVYWIPVYRHAFGKEPAPYWDRCIMVAAMITKDPQMKVMEIEDKIENPQWSKNVIEYLINQSPLDRFRFILGADQYEELDKWHDFDTVRRLASPIWIARNTISIPGEQVIQFNNPNSSTLIRRKIKDKESVSMLVGKEVYAYVQQKGLYKPNKKGD